MATTQPAEGFSLGGVLAGAWDTALGTFQRWVDSELGAEVALAQEAEASQAQQAAEQAPGGTTVAVAGYQFSLYTLLVVGAGALAIVYLLKR